MSNMLIIILLIYLIFDFKLTYKDEVWVDTGKFKRQIRIKIQEWLKS